MLTAHSEVQSPADLQLLTLLSYAVCSNCIRSYVSHQQGQARCPQCRAACDERDLRPNTGLRDLVDKLLQARPAYIAALRNQKSGPGRLVKASQHSQQQNAVSEHPGQVSSHKRQLRTSKATPDAVSATTDTAEAIVIEESPRKRQRSNASVAASQSAPPKAPSATPSADVAACPICNRTFKAGRVLEAHVNRCIDNPPAQEQPEQPQQQQAQPQKVARKVPKGAPQVKVPAKIAFHLINDRKLKDKLKDANLPIHGKRKVTFRGILACSP